MTKKNLLSIMAIMLSLAVIISSYALYKQNAEDKVVSITFGEIYELSIGSDGDETTAVNPNKSISLNITLKDAKLNGDDKQDEYTHGKFYIEITDDSPKDMLTFTLTKDNNTVAEHDRIVKTNDSTPEGYVTEIGKGDISLKVNYAISETAKSNYLNYAGKSVTVIFHWEFTTSLIKVNVYNRWNRNINYTLYKDETTVSYGTISNFENEYWGSIQVPKDITKITFKNEDNIVEVNLTDITANEVWTLYGDSEEKCSEVYTVNPESN